MEIACKAMVKHRENQLGIVSLKTGADRNEKTVLVYILIKTERESRREICKQTFYLLCHCHTECVSILTVQ